MNTREIAGGYRLTHWARIMHERQESGMSIKAYCKQQGFHENVYYYWQRKLREAACTEMAAREQEERGLVPGGWARLEPTSTVPSGSSVNIEINGCQVEVTAETDPELLVKVCRTLKAL